MSRNARRTIFFIHVRLIPSTESMEGKEKEEETSNDSFLMSYRDSC
jgi:hypothetical protein